MARAPVSEQAPIGRDRDVTKRLPRGFLEAFLEQLHVQEATQSSPRNETWRKPETLPNGALSCGYCGRPIDASSDHWKLDRLLPLYLGGVRKEANLVPACEACFTAKGTLDWLSWGRAQSKLAAAGLQQRRLAVLAVSANHLLRSPDIGKTKPYVLKLLQHRWQEPRILLHAAMASDVGLIAWGYQQPVSREAVGFLASRGASSVRANLRCWKVDADVFHDVVWHLIDRNALVKRVELGEPFVDPTVADEGDSRWHETFGSVEDIHRRRPKLPWRHPKTYPEGVEKPMHPAQRQHLAAMVALKNNLPVDREWLEHHRATDEAWLAAQQDAADRAWSTRYS